MRMKDVLARLANGGYRVSFERRVPSALCGDMFPARDEEPIENKEAAWELARQWAAAASDCVNIYVISAVTFKPVDGYERRLMNRYYP